MASPVRRTRRCLALVIAACALSLAACGGEEEASGAAAENPLVRISVGVDPAYTPMFVAQEEGLFEEAGLNVELVQTEGGAAGAQNVSAGVTELSGNADSTALTVMATNPDVRALGVFQESGRYLKVVLREGITDPSQIKRMATAQGLLLFATERYLESEGLSSESVELVKVAPPEMPPLLARGEVDGYVLFEPWAARGVENGGKVVATTGDYGVTYVQWIIANADWLADNEELAAQVFQVIAEASDIINTDPARAAEAVEAVINLPAAEAEAILPEIDFETRGFTPADFEQAKTIVSFFQERDAIDGPVDLDTVMLDGWYEEHVE